MPGTFLLPSPVGHAYYTWFYVLGFGLSLMLLGLEGHRRRYPAHQWLLTVAAASLFLILGSRLVPALLAGALPASSVFHSVAEGRTILGGLLGLVGGLTLARRLMGLDRSVYDAFSLPLLLGLAVQGVGCLLTGCCFGTPVASGWAPLAVAYASGTLPYAVHVQHGLLSAAATHSVPVHPAQLYQVLLCLLTALVVRGARRPQPPGASFLLALGLYVSGRFGLEFVRDVASDVLGTGYWHGLKPVQWVLLPAAVGLLSCWAWLRRAGRPAPPARAISARSASEVYGGVALLLLAWLVSPLWLDGAELLLVKGLVLGVLLLAVLRRALLAARLRQPLGVLGVAGLLMSQSSPLDSLSRPTAPQSRWTISTGATQGTFSHEIVPAGGGGCGGSLPPSVQHHRFQAYQLGAYYQRLSPTYATGYVRSRGWGLNLYRGTDHSTETFPYDDGSSARPTRLRRTVLWGVNPYLTLGKEKSARHNSVTARFGFVAGNVGRYTHGNLLHFSPDLAFAVHLRNLASMETGYGNGLLGIGNPVAFCGVGSRFGGAGRVYVGGGFAGGVAGDFTGNYSGSTGNIYYLRASLEPLPGLRIQPFYTFRRLDYRRTALQLEYDLRRK